MIGAVAVTSILPGTVVVAAQYEEPTQSVALGRTAASSRSVHPGARMNGPKATTTLCKLTVKGKAPKTGYNRTKYFGAAWSYDYNHNKCDTHDDILYRDMPSAKKKGRCNVRSGTLRDPYDGRTDHWKVGKGSVDIDHVVALGNAWISGAQYWTGTRGQTLRKSLANDPLNLVASDASQNRSKGDRNAAEWQPKNKGFRCQYVATQISVKYKYRLAVTKPEKQAMQRVLKGCKNQRAAKVGRLSIKTGASVAHQSKPKPTKNKGRYVRGHVHPGAFCSQHGYKGRSNKGVTYTCKTSRTESRYRWRR